LAFLSQHSSIWPRFFIPGLPTLQAWPPRRQAGRTTPRPVKAQAQTFQPSQLNPSTQRGLHGRRHARPTAFASSLFCAGAKAPAKKAAKAEGEGGTKKGKGRRKGKARLGERRTFGDGWHLLAQLFASLLLQAESYKIYLFKVLKQVKRARCLRITASVCFLVSLPSTARASPTSHSRCTPTPASPARPWPS
jgi:hypothetical protein